MNSENPSEKYHHPKSRDGSQQNYNPPPQGYVAAGYEDEDEIDLVELAAHFWSDRYMIAKVAGVFLVIGLFIALFSRVEYQTDAVLLPEIQSTSSQAGNLLNKYGGLLGISGGGVSSGPQGTIPPQIYPKIVESVPFQAELMNTPVTFASYDTTVTPHQFFRDVYSPTVIGYVKSYTLGLPGKILGGFSREETSASNNEIPLLILKRDSVYDLTPQQWATIGQLRKRVTVQIDQETGVVTLIAQMPDAQAAADLGKVGMRILKNYVQDYKTQNATEDLKFIQKQTETARKEFEAAQQQLTKFRDNNISLTSARAQSQEQELQSEYDLAFNTYNSLRQQREQAKISVQEQTPVFSILQPVTVPQSKSSPQRNLIMIVAFILGLIIGLGWSLLRSSSLLKEFKSHKTNKEVGLVS